MLMLLLVLNQTDKLEDLMEGLLEQGISGATILQSTGMIKELAGYKEYQPIFGSPFMDSTERKESKTIIMVLNEEKAAAARSVIRQVIGDITKPDTAVLFTLPVLSAEGMES